VGSFLTNISKKVCFDCLVGADRQETFSCCLLVNQKLKTFIRCMKVGDDTYTLLAKM
jgi:hypothetical protein